MALSWKHIKAKLYEYSLKKKKYYILKIHNLNTPAMAAEGVIFLP